jgi:hypothetical protein
MTEICEQASVVIQLFMIFFFLSFFSWRGTPANFEGGE